jgi:hypothetical protein
VGAAIGPGGSSQWISADYVDREWRFGLDLGRIRWNNDVYFRGQNRLEGAHDVTLFAGLRVGARVWGSEILAEVTPSYRLNYLFQNALLEPAGWNAVDKRSVSIRLQFSPE